MKKVFLCSPFVGLGAERTAATFALRRLHDTGGIELLNSEDFLARSEERTAIEGCLEKAREADEAFVLLGKHPGSPCPERVDPSFWKPVQDIIKSRTGIVWGYLSAKGRRQPPVSWTEAYWVRTKSKGLPLHVFRDPILETLREKYEQIRSDDRLGPFARRVKGLAKSFHASLKWEKLDSDEASCRLVWLLEYYLWLREDAGVNDLSVSEIRDFVQARYPGLTRVAKGCSFWVPEAEEAGVLKEMVELLEGEVWAWDNSISYLKNKWRFALVYSEDILKRYTEIRLCVRRPAWEEELPDEEAVKAVRTQLQTIGEHSNKIRVRLVDGQAPALPPLRPLTLLGIEGHRDCLGTLSLTRYWPAEHEVPIPSRGGAKGISPGERFTNFSLATKQPGDPFFNMLYERLAGLFNEKAEFLPITTQLDTRVAEIRARSSQAIPKRPDARAGTSNGGMAPELDK